MKLVKFKTLETLRNKVTLMTLTKSFHPLQSERDKTHEEWNRNRSISRRMGGIIQDANDAHSRHCHAYGIWSLITATN